MVLCDRSVRGLPVTSTPSSAAVRISVAVSSASMSAAAQDGVSPLDCIAHVDDCLLRTSLCRDRNLSRVALLTSAAGFWAQVSWLRAFLQHEPGKYVMQRKTNLAIAALLALVLALFITLTVVDKGPSHAGRCASHIIT